MEMKIMENKGFHNRKYDNNNKETSSSNNVFRHFSFIKLNVYYNKTLRLSRSTNFVLAPSTDHG